MVNWQQVKQKAAEKAVEIVVVAVVGGLVALLAKWLW